MEAKKSKSKHASVDVPETSPEQNTVRLAVDETQSASSSLKKPAKMTDTGAGLEALMKGDAGALRSAVVKAVNATPTPGQMSIDEAKRLMGEIANLFSGVARADVEMALMVWGILNGTGGEDDYAAKPDVAAGGKSVRATDIFGPIVPIGVSGTARQFMSVMFEKYVPRVLEADPSITAKLAPRVARAGLATGQAICVVDFVRGVESTTQGSSADRQFAKSALVERKSRNGRHAGGPRAPPPAQVTDLGTPTGSGGGGAADFWR